MRNQTKQCNRCKQHKTLTSYDKRSMCTCVDCNRAYQRERYQQSIRIQKKAKAYSKAHYIRLIINAQISRCNTPSSPQYKDYGGRGITVHHEWVNDVSKGVEWVLDNLGDRPTNKHILARIDTNGGYEPGNIKWSLPTNRHRRDTIYVIDALGNSVPAIQYYHSNKTKYTKSYDTFKRRIKKGITAMEAIK